MHNTETIVFRSIKGGQGCTTVALSHALRHAFGGKVTLLLTTSIEDVASMLGVQINEDGAISYDKLEVQPIEWGVTPGWESVIIDAGTSDRMFDATTILVTKNCYLALRRAVLARSKFDHVLCIMEPERAIKLDDVESLFDCKVIAVQQDARVARMVDAGLMGYRTQVGGQLDQL